MNTQSNRRQTIRIDRRTVDACIRLKQTGSRADLKRLVSTPGAKMTYAHHVWATPSSTMSIEEFWSEELEKVDWGPKTTDSLERVILYLKAHRRQWLEATLRYLPQGHRFDSTIYLIGGYDSIVYREDVALNLAFRKYQDDPREAVYYLIHELSHAGYFRYRPMPDLSGLRTTRDLLRSVQLLTQLEGMGVVSPLPERLREGGLEDDDYIALLSGRKLRARVREYFGLLSRLRDEPNRSLRREDPDLDDFSARPRRLWYVVGAHMALSIEECYGVKMLQDIVKGGPKEFFDAYERSKDQRSP